MTDDDLLETVRSELAEVRLGAPVQDVLARGNALRRQRRMLPAVGAGAGVAVAAAGLTLGLGAAGAPPIAPHASLDAWTITKLPNKTVSLTIRDAAKTRHDPLRLSRALAAVGISAIVRTRPPECGLRLSPYPPQEKPDSTTSPAPNEIVIRIKPRAIPKGTRVAIVLPATVRPYVRPATVHPARVHGRPVRSVASKPYVYLVRPFSRCGAKHRPEHSARH